jgi:non-ribosomal peptide synthetase component F
VSNGTVEDIYELSPLQQGMLLHSLHDGAADMYLSQHTYAVDGPLDAEALVGGWQAVVAAHPALRTSFHWEGLDKPLQVVHRDVPLPVRHHDWSGAGDGRQRERLAQLQAENRAAGFDPAVPPLQRLDVIRLGDRRYTLTWTYHHLLLDGWSIPIVLDEVMAWYRAAAVGAPRPRPVPAYREYIAWLQRQDLREARDFWTTALAEARPSHVARFGPTSPPGGTGAVERRTVGLPASLTGGLQQTAARHRVTFSTLVQAVWAIVLQGYTGQPEVTFGCATSGRPAELPQVERMVGVFANTLPLRVAVADDGDVGPWLRDIQGSYAAMRRYEYTPLAEIKKWAGMPGRQLFDSLLVLENYSLTVDAGGGQATAGEPVRFRVDTLYDKIDLPLTLTVAPHPVSEVQLLIHRDRFEPGFIDDILNRLHRTFEAIAAADRIAQVVSASGPRSVHPAEPGPAPVRGRPPAPTPPATAEEAAIAAVFQEILDTAGIDVTASFFELGGDSFAAVRAAGRIDGASVGMLAAHPSARELARALARPAASDAETGLDDEIAELERMLAAKRAAREQQAGSAQVVPVPRGGELACTCQQEGLWFLHQLLPSSPVYHIPYPFLLHGPLDVGALERAVHALMVRHEALRTRFVAHDGVPRQVIDPPPPAFALPVAEIGAGQAEQWGQREAYEPFDLAAGQLFRVSLARLAPEEYLIVLVVHHIVGDGWSLRILADEIALLYAAETGGGPAGLAPLHLQAADYAAWQRGRLDGTQMQRQLAYWHQTLAGLPTIDFPADRPRPARPAGTWTSLSRRLPDELTAAIRAYARASQGSLLAVVHAALLIVLHRYTGQEDLPIGSVFSGRTRAETEPLVGFFANTLVLRTGVGGDPSFAELVDRCRQTILAAAAHQDVPFGLIVDALQPERVPGRNPLFQISLTLQPADTRPALTLDPVTVEPISFPEGHSRFDLSVDIFDKVDTIDIKFEYAAEMFDVERIERLYGHIVAALAGGLAAPGGRIGGIRLGDRPGQRDNAGGDPARRRSDGRTEYLRRTDPAPAARTVRYVAPRTATQRWLAAAWQELLGVERVGAHDNFFDLGGSSLLGMQLIARIRDRLQVELDPWHLLTCQVLEQLAGQLDRSAAAAAETPAAADALAGVGTPREQGR